MIHLILQTKLLLHLLLKGLQADKEVLDHHSVVLDAPIPALVSSVQLPLFRLFWA